MGRVLFRPVTVLVLLTVLSLLAPLRDAWVGTDPAAADPGFTQPGVHANKEELSYLSLLSVTLDIMIAGVAVFCFWISPSKGGGQKGWAVMIVAMPLMVATEALGLYLSHAHHPFAPYRVLNVLMYSTGLLGPVLIGGVLWSLRQTERPVFRIGAVGIVLIGLDYCLGRALPKQPYGGVIEESCEVLGAMCLLIAVTSAFLVRWKNEIKKEQASL